jgi:hypothetical protein
MGRASFTTAGPKRIPAREFEGVDLLKDWRGPPSTPVAEQQGYWLERRFPLWLQRPKARPQAKK